MKIKIAIVIDPTHGHVSLYFFEREPTHEEIENAHSSPLSEHDYELDECDTRLIIENKGY